MAVPLLWRMCGESTPEGRGYDQGGPNGNPSLCKAAPLTYSTWYLLTYINNRSNSLTEVFFLLSISTTTPFPPHLYVLQCTLCLIIYRV